MQSIYINKKESFVVHFYNTSMKIEKKGRLPEEIAYNEVVSFKLKKGKKQIMLTIFIVFISFIMPSLLPRKVFKVYDQLLIELKNEKIITYQVRRSIDIDKVNEVINYIRQRKSIKFLYFFLKG